MLDIKFIRENIEVVRDSLRKRGYSTELLDHLKLYDVKRREVIQDLDEQRRRRNILQQRINQGERAFIEETKAISEHIENLERTLKTFEERIGETPYLIPNIPHLSVPEGKGPEDNQEIKRWGEIPKFSFVPKPHWEIGEALGILDSKSAAKLSGSRFSLYMGNGALLERALINFMLDLHTKENGYKEVMSPFLVNSKTMTGTGQLPKFADDLFKCQDSDLWLIPTAEVPLTNIHSNEILTEDELPILYTGWTACFRKEAGSYGKETKGLIRQHQFNKIELVRITQSEDSYDHLEKLTNDTEEVLKRLELPYRVVVLCTGDLGFSASKTYDIEVWMPGMGKYVEVSSCSNFEDFQARRANIKYRTKNKEQRAKNIEIRYVHTLNGSGLAAGRTFAAILENYQTEDGRVSIPSILQQWLGGDKI